MADSHIHRGMTPEERATRDAAMVADYVGGMRQRGIKKKYRTSAESLTALLEASGLSARKGGKRIWINKRVRPDNVNDLRCSKCGATKLIDEFPPRGLVCMDCVNARLAAWRDENRDEMNRYIREWTSAKKKKDPKFRAICAMKARLVRILGASGKKKSKASVTEFLGISRNGFVAHIESLMLPGMTWENRSIGVWHIDHIIPCSVFDHSIPRQVKDCWHYTNLRPLWGKENLVKYNKMTTDSIIGPKMADFVAHQKSLGMGALQK